MSHSFELELEALVIKSAIEIDTIGRIVIRLYERASGRSGIEVLKARFGEPGVRIGGALGIFGLRRLRHLATLDRAGPKIFLVGNNYCDDSWKLGYSLTDGAPMANPGGYAKPHLDRSAMQIVACSSGDCGGPLLQVTSAFHLPLCNPAPAARGGFGPRFRTKGWLICAFIPK